MYVVLDFENVIGCVDGFIGCHVGMFLVCCLASFRCTPPQAWVGGNCLVVGVFYCWKVVLVYVFVPCNVDDLLYVLLCVWVVYSVFGLLVDVVSPLELIGLCIVWCGVGICFRYVVLRVPLMH
jgi:hypothetical protein